MAEHTAQAAASWIPSFTGVLSYASGPLLAFLAMLTPILGPFVMMGGQIFGWWLGVLVAAPTGIWTLWRCTRGKSWALLLVVTLVLALIFFGWLIPVQILQHEIERNLADAEEDHLTRCHGNPKTTRFVLTCHASATEITMDPREYAHVLLVEKYATWIHTIGWITTAAMGFMLLTALGIIGLCAGCHWDRRRQAIDAQVAALYSHAKHVAAATYLEDARHHDTHALKASLDSG